MSVSIDTVSSLCFMFPWQTNNYELVFTRVNPEDLYLVVCIRNKRTKEFLTLLQFFQLFFMSEYLVGFGNFTYGKDGKSKSYSANYLTGNLLFVIFLFFIISIIYMLFI